MYNPRDIIDVIAANVRNTRNPFGIPKFLLNQWHQKLQIPETGDAMLFTGMMYQFVPYIETSTDYLAQFEDSNWARYLRYARYVPGYLSGLGLALITPGAQKRNMMRFSRLSSGSLPPLASVTSTVRNWMITAVFCFTIWEIRSHLCVMPVM